MPTSYNFQASISFSSFLSKTEEDYMRKVMKLTREGIEMQKREGWIII